MIEEMLRSGKACLNEGALKGKCQMKYSSNSLSLSLACAMIFLVAGLFMITGPGAAEAKSGPYSPHFASLKADEVHVRKGPGRKYDILWTYRSLGLPLEVTAEHEHWRRVRDSSGAEGWVYFRLLSALRMALVSPWKKEKIAISLYTEASAEASTLVRLEPGVKVLVKSCTGRWCLVSVGGFKGWIEQIKLWGVYPGEVLK